MMPSPATHLQPGSATSEGTRSYSQRFVDRAATGHFREGLGAPGMKMSSLGIGTYLGEPDEATDLAYTEAVVAAVAGGINVIDTAINYRFQRSERSVGAALRRLTAAGYRREEVILCTKAGFLTPDGEMPADAEKYFRQEFLETSVFAAEDVAAGCHCMAPAYLENQLERSRQNLGAACVDVFYLHNPETQLAEVDRGEFRNRVRKAFQFLESAVTGGKIQAYGLATWNGFRQDAKERDYLSLPEMTGLAHDAGGDAHHFRFVQLPYNLAMPEALTRPNQTLEGRAVPVVQAARSLGITLISSAALLQGQLATNLPPFVADALGLSSDRLRALQFARSSPGITTALVGMSRAEHVRANLALAGVPPASREQFLKLFEARGQ
jgi:aryl-alcohol dehydrogenase-like predicted oxidoreductase